MYLSPWFGLQRSLIRELEAARPIPFEVPANLHDTGSAYVVELLVPGVEASALTITTTDQELRVQGARSLPVPEGYTALRQERASGKFERSFSFPERLDVEGVRAEVKNGVLRVTLPRQAAVQPRTVPVHDLSAPSSATPTA